MLLGLVEQLPVYCDLLEFLLGFLVALAVLSHHHLLDLLLLLDCGLEVPLLSLQLLVFLPDGLYFLSDLFDLLLEVGDPLLTLLSDLLNLLLE